MAVIPRLVGRSEDSVSMTPTMMNLLIALVVLFAVGFLCIGLLTILRSYHKKTLSKNPEMPQRSSSRISHRRHGATTTPLSVRVSEKEMLVDEKELMTPESLVPEIRITFPDEDAKGEKRDTQVMVLKMSDKGAVGLEPYHEEDLPPYQKSNERLESLDLERLGGLKEKQRLSKAG